MKTLHSSQPFAYSFDLPDGKIQAHYVKLESVEFEKGEADDLQFALLAAAPELDPHPDIKHRLRELLQCLEGNREHFEEPLTPKPMEPGVKTVRSEIRASLDRLADTAVSDGLTRDVVRAAILSGMSLTAHWLVANDGSEAITPTNVERAIHQIGADLGLGKGKLR